MLKETVILGKTEIQQFYNWKKINFNGKFCYVYRFRKLVQFLHKIILFTFIIQKVDLKIFKEFTLLFITYLLFNIFFLRFMYFWKISFVFLSIVYDPICHFYVRRFRNKYCDNLEPIGKYKRDKRCTKTLWESTFSE